MDYWSRDMLNFNFSERGLVFPHFVNDFSKNVSYVSHSINWPNFILWFPLLLEILVNMCIRPCAVDLSFIKTYTHQKIQALFCCIHIDYTANFVQKCFVFLSIFSFEYKNRKEKYTLMLMGHKHHFSSTRSKKTLQFLYSKFYLWPHIYRIFHWSLARFSRKACFCRISNFVQQFSFFLILFVLS